MREPLAEAYELVEDGYITDDNFRDFVFTNAVTLWGTQNPDFFEGTRVEKEAAAVLQAASQPALRRRGEVGPGQTPPPSCHWGEGCSGCRPRLSGRPIPTGAGGKFPATREISPSGPGLLGFVHSLQGLEGFSLSRDQGNRRTRTGTCRSRAGD